MSVVSYQSSQQADGAWKGAVLELFWKERKNDKYIEIDPIEINIETISENNEYILGNVSLKDNSREDIVLEKENNTIILEIKNKKKITGTYNIKIKKINSLPAKNKI